ncbi:MAG: hypothetical protein H6R20_363 [Proteobacteria bacterium]|nr:hypothetical protein [Pseudomonadota bacterium]
MYAANPAATIAASARSPMTGRAARRHAAILVVLAMDSAVGAE